MVAAQRSKPPDKQEICRKVTASLKKAYHSTPSRQDLPFLETLLYAICLEDTTPEAAEAAYGRLFQVFRDLNEARVSSIPELQAVFHDQEHSAWRALRVKNALQFAFDSNYAFELESLKRKTAELAGKQLARVTGLSYFVRSWALSHCLGIHLLPVDEKMHAALCWLGLVEPDSQPEQAADSLRGSIRKADAPLFCHLLRCLAVDPKRAKVFAGGARGVDRAGSPDEGLHRLEILMSKGPAAVPKSSIATARPPANSKKDGSAVVAASAGSGAVKVGTGKAGAGKPPLASARPAAAAKPASPPAKTAVSKATGGATRATPGPAKPSAAKPAAIRPAASRGAASKVAGGKPPARGKPDAKPEGRQDAKKRH
ncbi:MAG: hypothetical protein EHM42_13330 [Planctomycetaceae bacterium]|nr:MAG: hypothetical protein EHM42_13330 [Planctomycetaceae bacterium]